MSTPKFAKGTRVTAREYEGSPQGTVEGVRTIRKQKYVWVRWDDADKLFYGEAIMEPATRLQEVR